MAPRVRSEDWDEVDENTLIADCWLDFLSTRDFASAGPTCSRPRVTPADAGERESPGRTAERAGEQ